MSERRTYERPPEGAEGVGLEGYTVFDERGEALGRVTTVTERGGQVELVLGDGAPPFGGKPAVVSWSAVRSVDHERLAIEITEAGEVDELQSEQLVEAGGGAGEARRLTDVPSGTPSAVAPDERRVRPRPLVAVGWALFFLSSVLFLPPIALAFGAGSLWYLLLLAVPAALLAIAATLIRRSLRAPYEAPPRTS